MLKSISIVIPCYNPIDNWCASLIVDIQRLNACLPDYFIQYIISNDGSTRLNTCEISNLTALPNVHFLNNQVNEGKGSAIRKGMLMATGEIIIYTDIDFPFGIEPVKEMVRILQENKDCRFVYGNRTRAYFKKLPLKRQVVSKMLHLLNRAFLSKNITDTQAGIKALRRDLLPDIQETRTNTFVFEIELIRKLIRKKIVIASVDVEANPSIVFTNFSTKVLFTESVNLARILIRPQSRAKKITTRLFIFSRLRRRHAQQLP